MFSNAFQYSLSMFSNAFQMIQCFSILSNMISHCYGCCIDFYISFYIGFCITLCIGYCPNASALGPERALRGDSRCCSKLPNPWFSCLFCHWAPWRIFLFMIWIPFVSLVDNHHLRMLSTLIDTTMSVWFRHRITAVIFVDVWALRILTKKF